MKTRVLITGASGFIGSYLVKRLQDEYDIFEFDRKIDKMMDITYSVKLDSVFTQFKPHYVIHLAAYCGEDEKENRDVNVSGTYNIVNICKRHNVELLLFSSSAAVYGNATVIPTPENCKLKPISPYGKSKMEAEKMIIESGIPYLKLRFSNVYGKGGRGIVSLLKDKDYKNKKKKTVVYLGTQTRDFIHIRDLTLAIKKCLKDQIYNTVLNLSTAKETSLVQLLLMTRAFSRITIKPPRNNEIHRSCLDNTKILQSIKWKPKVSIEEGVKYYETIKTE